MNAETLPVLLAYKMLNNAKDRQTDVQTDIPRLCFSWSVWLGSLVPDMTGEMTLGICHSATVPATTTTTTATKHVRLLPSASKVTTTWCFVN